HVFAGFRLGDNFAMVHALNASIVIPLTILVLIGLSFAARLPGRMKWQTGALFGLMVLQFVLAGIGFARNAALRPLAVLHGVNALAIVGLTSWLVYRGWAFRPATASQPSAATALQPTSDTAASAP